jgi:NitT/TauT family transport system ATP-binding protein
MHEFVSNTFASSIAIQVRDVRRVFEGGVVALDGLSLDIRAGEFVAILGPSGCGKSTLLRIIAGLDQPQAGEVQLQNEDGSSRELRRGDVAYVFQDAHLLPWRNVLDNVALPLELMGVDRHKRREQSLVAIERVGLGEAAGRYPNQLSGGMRMRVSLARAMVTQPRLLLLDEPFAALDEITRQRLDEQLRELWLDMRMTIVFVTHSTAEATFLADRAVVFSRRPAHIIEDRPIELPPHRTGPLRATTEFAAQTRGIYEALERGQA